MHFCIILYTFANIKLAYKHAHNFKVNTILYFKIAYFLNSSIYCILSLSYFYLYRKVL